MASIIVLFGKPQNTQEFDELYWKEHVPMAKKLPGLRRYTIHKVSAPPGRDPPFYQVVEMEFDSMEDLKKATKSPESQQSTQHASRIATGGMTFLYTETKKVL